MRSLLARVDAIAGTLPEAVVTVAQADEAARNHALAEGHPDPDPNPLLDEDGQQRRRPTRTGTRARRRETFAGMGTGGGTHVAISGENRKTAIDQGMCTTPPSMCTTSGGE